MNYEVKYAKHAILTPNEVDIIKFAVSVPQALIIVCNQHETAPLWFEFTYVDGTPPRENIEPWQDDVFMVLPKNALQFTSPHYVNEFTVVSHEANPYTVQIMY